MRHKKIPKTIRSWAQKTPKGIRSWTQKHLKAPNHGYRKQTQTCD